MVRAFDYSIWQVVVMAESRDAALAKAQAMYAIDGSGNADSFAQVDRDVDWEAYALVEDHQ
jgi:hypothetical protein